jgi:hypothetical protein
LRAAALCKYRLETVFDAWLRGARSASVDPTANHQDVQKQCVHAALQFILTVRDRGDRPTVSHSSFAVLVLGCWWHQPWYRLSRPRSLSLPVWRRSLPSRILG